MMAKHTGISLVIYSSVNDGDFRKIFKEVSRRFSPLKITLCNCPEEVADALKEAMSGHGIVVMMIRDEKELNRMIFLGDRFKDHSVILILDNLPHDMTQQALKLHPRYTSSFKDDYADIFMVLEKMTATIEKKFKGEGNGRGREGCEY